MKTVTHTWVLKNLDETFDRASQGECFIVTKRGKPSYEIVPHGHRTVGGIDDRIESTLPPVFRPKIVPRS